MLPVILILFFIAFVEAKVVLVVDMVRHGARASPAPCSFFPNITWPTYDELTPVGLRQHYLLGRLRRSQYIEKSGLLPYTYDPTTIHVRSTDLRRTMMSAQAYLLGLYPTGLPDFNTNQTQDNYNLLVPPVKMKVGDDIIKRLGTRAVPFGTPLIPIQTVDATAEGILVSTDCPFVTDQLIKYFASAQYQKLIQETYKSMWEEIMQNYPAITWQYLKDQTNAFVLADFLLCAEKDGQRPYKLTAKIIEKLKEFVGEVLKGVDSMDPLMNKLAMSEITKKILEYMERVIEVKKENKIKYVLYSGHDVTLLVMLVGLKKINDTININKEPEFAGNVLFELSVEEGQEGKKEEAYSVTIYYNGNVIHTENYAEFKEKFKGIGKIGTTREEACQVKNRIRGSKENKPADFNFYW